MTRIAVRLVPKAGAVAKRPFGPAKGAIHLQFASTVALTRCFAHLSVCPATSPEIYGRLSKATAALGSLLMICLASCPLYF
eukprot:9880460-Heterocapsa_arctica.AAC.1